MAGVGTALAVAVGAVVRALVGGRAVVVALDVFDGEDGVTGAGVLAGAGVAGSEVQAITNTINAAPADEA